MANNAELGEIRAGDGADVYFAATQLDDAVRARNIELTARIEREFGLDVFMPQRNGLPITDSLDGNVAETDARERSADANLRQIMGSHIMIAVLDGRVPDDGVAYEIGVANTHRQMDPYSQHRQIIGYKTSPHAFATNQELNPVIQESLDYVARSPEELLHTIGHAVLDQTWYLASRARSSYHDHVAYM